MSKSTALAFVAAATTGISLAAQSPLPVDPSTTMGVASSAATFHGGVELVALTVTVTDRSQRLIRDLAATDFAVVEDGVAQPVTFFGTADVPLDLALVVDTSSSMGDKIAVLQQAAKGLVRRLRPIDRVALVEFSNVVSIRQPLTSNVEHVQAAIDGVRVAGNTGLFDALVITLRDLARQAPASEVRRQAVVLFSDGVDTSSHVSFEEVLDLARQCGIAVYTVALQSPAGRSRGLERSQSEADYGMRRLAVETGARAFFPASLRDVRPIYDGIAEELASQYAIGYLPGRSVRAGAWRQVVVQVAGRPGARARARQGYYAGSGPSSFSRVLTAWR